MVTAQQPIVLSIHGIRTTGAWQKRINTILAEAGFVHYPYDYGFFFALKMLFPFLRSRRVVAFREFYESVRAQAPRVPISLIAHSFGTYIAAKAMEKYAQVSFDQIIFCGSIVQCKYDWAGIIERKQANHVLHDYGNKDIWVRLAEWVITDAGPSGQVGFINPPPDRVIQQVHPNFRHSDHFYTSNFRQRWVPFLRGEALPMILPVRPPPFNWKPWVLYLIIGGLMIIGGLIVWSWMSGESSEIEQIEVLIGKLKTQVDNYERRKESGDRLDEVSHDVENIVNGFESRSVERLSMSEQVWLYDSQSFASLVIASAEHIIMTKRTEHRRRNDESVALMYDQNEETTRRLIVYAEKAASVANSSEQAFKKVAKKQEMWLRKKKIPERVVVTKAVSLSILAHYGARNLTDAYHAIMKAERGARTQLQEANDPHVKWVREQIRAIRMVPP